MRHTYPWAVLVVPVLTKGAGHLYGQDACRPQGRVMVQKEDADAFSGVSQTERQGWRAGLEKIRSVVLQAPLLQPPHGYHVHTGYLATAAPAEGLPWLKASRASLFFQLAPLYEDKGKLPEDPQGGAEIIVQVNNFVYPRTFVPLLNELNNPQHDFFLLDGVTKDSLSPAEWILRVGRDNAVRLITGGKPLFVPYRQGQYMRFKIARDRKALQEARAACGRPAQPGTYEQG